MDEVGVRLHALAVGAPRGARVPYCAVHDAAQILSLRVDYSSKQEAFAAYQRKEMERDARNAELLACIRRAEVEGTLAGACF